MANPKSPAAASSATTAPAAEPAPDDALSHLARMSGTGSAFGQSNYVAISPMAVISAVLAVFSLIALAFPAMTAVAVVALLLASLAIYRIRHSNGTQAGIVPAVLGIVIALGAVGGVVTRQLLEWSNTREQTRQCADVISRFGQHMKDRKYREAYYSLTTKAFRDQFDLNTFETTMAQFENHPDLGQIQEFSMRERMQFEPHGSGTQGAAIVMVKCVKREFEEGVVVNNLDGAWKIDKMPQIFPDPKKGFGGSRRPPPQ